MKTARHTSRATAGAVCAVLSIGLLPACSDESGSDETPTVVAPRDPAPEDGATSMPPLGDPDAVAGPHDPAPEDGATSTPPLGDPDAVAGL